MKKTALIIIAIITSIQLSAQWETNIKLGVSSYNGNEINTTAGLYPYAAFGYHFFNQEHITLIPSLFIEKSGFTLQDLSFGLPTPKGVFETSDITYRMYSAGLTINAEIKLLNLNKKTNVYISPSFGLRKLFYYEGIPSNPKLGGKLTGSDIAIGLLYDWGMSIGVKLEKFKFSIFYRDVINQNNPNNSSFVNLKSFGLSVSYLFGNNGTKKDKEVEQE